MPSAEETRTTFLIDMVPSAQDIGQDGFSSRDVDVLVSRIKENLRLTGLKSRSSLAQKIHRATPYRLPSRSWAEPSDKRVVSKHHHHHHKATTTTFAELEDSYERFQALLRKGSLIKEAVKRLQTNEEEDEELLEEDLLAKGPSSRAYSAATLDSMDEDEDEDESSNDQDFLYRRKPFYYDSEDEPLPSQGYHDQQSAHDDIIDVEL